MRDREIEFTTFDKGLWLKKISDIYLHYSAEREAEDISFSFHSSLMRGAMEPLHVVTYACLIHYLIGKGHIVRQNLRNKDIFDYIFQELNFAAYWRGGKNHVEAASSHNIFNLWRIVETEKDMYAKQVEQYFKRTYFADRDLSAVSISLVEAFYNVFDHAEADGNAFSIIFYNEKTQILSYAVSDFGIGIPTSVRRMLPDIDKDTDAINWAIKDTSTVRSTARNKGYGMSNILASAQIARIFSNHGLLVKTQDMFKSHTIDDFFFPGTIIYLEIDMSTFEKEEVLDTFTI